VLGFAPHPTAPSGPCCTRLGRAVVRYLLRKKFEPIAGLGEVVRHTPLYAISIAMIFIGLFAFGAVFIRAA